MRFSIIIPVYNVRDYLQKCIDSVLANDCTDCDIILVDDGSTDGACPRICDENAARHPDLIRVIHQENRGLGGARNTGLEAAEGEYLLFLDSDDTIAPHTLKTLSDAIHRSGADIVAFNLYSDDGEGRLTPIRANHILADEPFSLEERPEFLLSLPSAWSRAWKRELFLRSGVRYPDRVWYEDIRTSTKLFACARSIYTVDEYLYNYLQRPGSIMNSARLERNREILDAFDDVLQWFEQQGLRQRYERELTRLAVDHIRLAAAVRVARMDPRSPLLGEFETYMQTHFPHSGSNPYLAQLPRLHKLLLKLMDHKRYGLIRALFRLKDGA